MEKDSMKRLMIIALAAIASSGVFAQDNAEASPEKPNGARMMQRPMMGGQGPWLVRMFTKKDNFEKLGITDKAKADKLLADLESIKDEGNAIEKKVREISREQAELMRKLFADKAADSKEVMAKIDEVAKLRAEQARLSVKTILTLRENLTEEQMQNARNMMMERGQMRRSMRRGVGMSEPGRRPMRGKGRKAASRNPADSE
jgi:Spy/CpxP family protein refolding chaperone